MSSHCPARSDIPAIILAGGESRRMGEDKALLKLDRDTLLDHVSRRLGQQTGSLAISRHRADEGITGLPVIPDSDTAFEGPLSGIMAALEYFSAKDKDASHMLSVAVDTPFFPDNLLTQLSGQCDSGDLIVIARSGGRVHPVFALWPFALLADLRHWIGSQPSRRLMAFIDRHPHRFVDFADIEGLEGLGAPLDPFFNINTPEDLARARQIVAASPQQ